MAASPRSSRKRRRAIPITSQSKVHAEASTSAWPAIQDWKLALGLLISLRLGLELVGLHTLLLQPITVFNGDWTNLVMRGDDLGTRWLSLWQRWDALWYQEIATNGYRAVERTTHFQPLYPLLCRVVSVPLFGQIVLAELIVSSAAFVVAMVLLFRLTRMETGLPGVALLTVLLTALAPSGFFLFAPYTESLYLALTVAAFYCARQDRFWIAGAAAAGATLTRIFGVLLILPLAYEYIRRRREGGEPLRVEGLSTLLPLIAYGLLVLYQRFVVGETRSPLQLSSYWSNQFVAPWQLLSNALTYIRDTGYPAETLSIVSLLGFLVLGILCIGRLPLLYALYVLPNVVLLACIDQLPAPLMSDSRYVLVLFPCWIVLALWLVRRPWLALAALILGLTLQVTFFIDWVRFAFVA